MRGYGESGVRDRSYYGNIQNLLIYSYFQLFYYFLLLSISIEGGDTYTLYALIFYYIFYFYFRNGKFLTKFLILSLFLTLNCSIKSITLTDTLITLSINILIDIFNNFRFPYKSITIIISLFIIYICIIEIVNYYIFASVDFVLILYIIIWPDFKPKYKYYLYALKHVGIYGNFIF